MAYTTLRSFRFEQISRTGYCFIHPIPVVYCMTKLEVAEDNETWTRLCNSDGELVYEKINTVAKQQAVLSISSRYSPHISSRGIISSR